MKRYCEKCGKGQKVKTVQKTEVFQVLDDHVETSVELVECAVCNNVLIRKEPDEQTLLDAYRKKKQLLFPEEIRAIRNQYDLSIRAFSCLLHWGEKTVAAYEQGKAIPDSVHNNLLILLRNPENMRIYLERNRSQISLRNMKRIIQKIDQLTMPVSSHRSFFHRYFSEIPNQWNGNKAFDYRTASAMILFFASFEKSISRMKLINLMYYADMLYFGKYGVSMSGLRYVHRSFGAIAENIDILLGIMEEDQLIHIHVEYFRRHEEYDVVSECDLPEGMLDEVQKNTLLYVCRQFTDWDAKKLVKQIRKEKNFRRVKDGEYLRYDCPSIR